MPDDTDYRDLLTALRFPLAGELPPRHLHLLANLLTLARRRDPDQVVGELLADVIFRGTLDLIGDELERLRARQVTPLPLPHVLDS